ncbi:hypothetical protein K474DRAFT_1659824 [Panus rudis PR-1116 ss-1]|nr:hypothetical protein K474DRAFT_1659824 [Panus rudis PR-1116 ss-1]
MGSLCSKAGTHSGSHIPLRSPVNAANGQTVGATSSERPDPRAAALEAAEQRRKAAQARGTNVANPNQGRLAAQLEANKTAPRVPEPRQPDRLVWD